MEKTDKMFDMLEQIISKLDNHESMLKKQDTLLQNQGSKLQDQSALLRDQDTKLQDHGSILQDHSQMLRALQSGQEHLKAELDGMKVSNAKEFAAIKKEQGNISAKFELLREDSWINRQDIHRIKNTMGMN